MHLVPTTPAAKKAFDSYNQLPADPELPKETFFELLLLPVMGTLLITHVFVDAGTNPELVMKWGLLGFGWGIGNCIIMYARKYHRRKVEQHYNHLCESEEIVTVDAELEQRWFDMCGKLDLEYEPRADIENFPEALRKIVVLQEARKSNPERAMRKKLDNRLAMIMREALEPLAAELAVLRELEEEQQAILERARRDEQETLQLIRQVGQRAKAEALLLAS